MAGYPADKMAGTMWGMSGRVTAVSARGINHDLDTFAGMVGSPIYNGSSKGVLAVHVGSGGTNRAVRLTEEAVNRITAWITEGEKPKAKE